MSELARLTPGDGYQAVAETVARDGGCIVVDAVDPELLDRVRAEMEPYIEATPTSNVSLNGLHTRRTGGLAGRSAAARQLIMHPLVLQAARLILASAPSVQISNTEIISIGPGEAAQSLHRDQDIWEYSFPDGFELTFSVMWPITDFTAENGATRLIPGSHRGGFREVYPESEIVTAEMSKGSFLIWSGALAHGGGANRTGQVRQGVMLAYALGWLRQEENQYLAVPREVASGLDPELLKLIGYARGGQALGNGVDRSHPLGLFYPELARPGQVELDLLEGYRLSRAE
jgi:ectoine hydroxylase-related dioxygenase (phytanoyl-CoA dioxygenase family)